MDAEKEIGADSPACECFVDSGEGIALPRDAFALVWVYWDSNPGHETDKLKSFETD